VIVAPLLRCAEVDGPHFEFDRSFVRRAGLEPIGKVAVVLALETLRAAVFGHTDTVGAEDYNKRLSERRARAVAAALVHDAQAWEELYQEESWGTLAVQRMLNAVDGAGLTEDGLDGPATDAAIEAFQKESGLKADHIAGPDTRRALFLAYMK